MNSNLFSANESLKLVYNYTSIFLNERGLYLRRRTSRHEVCSASEDWSQG